MGGRGHAFEGDDIADVYIVIVEFLGHCSLLSLNQGRAGLDHRLALLVFHFGFKHGKLHELARLVLLL